MSFFQKHVPIYNNKWLKFKALTLPERCTLAHTSFLGLDCEGCFARSPDFPPCQRTAEDIAEVAKKIRAQTELEKAKKEFSSVVRS